MLTASSSLRMLPEDDDSTRRISSSISFRRRLFSAPCTINLLFSSSRSGRSFATTTPSSWSASPSAVVTKLSTETAVQSSGGKCGLRSFVVM